MHPKNAQTEETEETAETEEPEEVRHFRLLLEFDGSGFEGWQMQRQGERTVQGCLSEAVNQVAPGDARVTGSSRTDSGVHAEGFVASLQLATALEPRDLRRALNALLPDDVVVREIDETASDFDARRQACWKAYRYSIWNRPQRSPLRARRALHVRHELDLAAMTSAASQLVGERDFACFQAAGSHVEHTVRTLYRVAVLQPSEGEVVIEVEGSGFLRYMVRNIVGTLLEVGRGRRSAAGIRELIESRDRRLAGPTAAAHGLTLVRVGYTPHALEALSDTVEPSTSPRESEIWGEPPGGAVNRLVFSEKS